MMLTSKPPTFGISLYRVDEWQSRRMAEAVASNVWHMVAEKKWNNQSFAPTTSVKDTHLDFALPISIPFDAICNFIPVTPEKMEEKWNAMNLALKRQIQNWERSGQGDGGYTEEVDDKDEGDDDADKDNMNTFGSLNGRPQRALDSRQNFFDDRSTYLLLYLWDVLDEHDLVKASMQQLLEGIGSGNGGTGVPSVIGGSAKVMQMIRLHHLKRARDGTTMMRHILRSTASPSSLPQRFLQANRQRIARNKLPVRLMQGLTHCLIVRGPWNFA